MKRLLFLVLLLLLLISLNACTAALLGPLPPHVHTAVAETQTAEIWTPTISPTTVPNSSKIVVWLNEEFSSLDTSLEQTLEANYHVTLVSFPISPNNNVSLYFRVDVRCDCSTYGGCCNPERIFGRIMQAIQNHREEIFEQVPVTVSEIRVVCYDHMTYLTTVAAPWIDTKNYLGGDLSGYEFGARISRSSMP